MVGTHQGVAVVVAVNNKLVLILTRHTLARAGLLLLLSTTQQQQISPYFDPTYTRTGWIGQPPVLDRHEVVTDNGEVDTLRQATP